MRASITIKYCTKTTILKFIFKPDQSIIEVRDEFLEMNGNEAAPFELKIPPRLAEKQWIEHFLDVFVYEEAVSLTIPAPTERSFEDIYELLKDFNIVGLNMGSSEIRDSQFHKLFPSLEHLGVRDNRIDSSILVENFPSLTGKNGSLDDISHTKK